MLFFALDLGFHAPTSLRPLVDCLLGFFVASLLLEKAILVFKPYGLQPLFNEGVRGIVVEVGSAALESILLLVHDFLGLAVRSIRHVGCVESIKRLLSHCTLGLFET